ncbi:hypothetical protein [Sphaerisporangium sp. NPDC051011]|uniref:hypothetical protein n=1 Tax=Sphaerisporangium sp. NPDC051011 TaxID=3155792 RepID=UPI0033E59EB7
MAVTAFNYGLFQKSMLEARINWVSDTIKAMPLASYTIGSTRDTAQYLSDVVTGGVAVEATGGGSTGYTPGGLTLTGKTLTYTAANSWTTQRANATAYAAGAVVRPATGNGFLYQATVAGTTGGAVPTYPTVVGQTVTDGGVVWACVGTGALVATGTIPPITTGNPGSFTASFLLFYKDTGTPSTSPLATCWDLGGAQPASNGGPWTPTPDAGQGILISFTN